MISAGSRPHAGRVVITAAALALACTPACGSVVNPEQADTDASGASGDGPSSGAPDERCGPLDPDRVYVVRASTIPGVHVVTDAEDRARVCAYADPEDVVWDLPGRIDPGDGSLVVLQAGREARRPAVLRLQHDWLVPSGDESTPWTAAMPTPDDVLGVVAGDDGDCPATAFARGEVSLAWSDGFYTACERTVAAPGGGARSSFATGRFIGVVDGAALVHTDGNSPGAPGSYAAVVDGERVELSPPAGVDRIAHVAARPGPEGLLAAVRMHHGELITLERVWLHPSGITRAGSYDEDPAERAACVSYAIAADASLWCVSDDPVPTLVRAGPTGPAAVAFGLTDGTGPARLLSTGGALR